MKTITINRDKYTFPDGWNEITLNQFQQINEIKLNNDLEDELAMISILSGIDSEELLDLPYSEYGKLRQLCAFRNDVTNKQPPTHIIEINNVKYGYRHTISDMTTSEFIDYTNILKSENLIANMHILMAILYRPIIKFKTNKSIPESYIIEKYDASTVFERAELFQENMYMNVVLSAMVFHVALLTAYIEHITDSLELMQQSGNKTVKKKMLKTIQNKIKTLLKSGDGIIP